MVHKFDLIWVIVDRLCKSTHFIHIRTKYRVEKYAEIYIAQVLCPHGVPKTLISDRLPLALGSNCMHPSRLT
jgi:hypothetical protein